MIRNSDYTVFNNLFWRLIAWGRNCIRNFVLLRDELLWGKPESIEIIFLTYLLICRFRSQFPGFAFMGHITMLLFPLMMMIMLPHCSKRDESKQGSWYFFSVKWLTQRRIFMPSVLITRSIQKIINCLLETIDSTISSRVEHFGSNTLQIIIGRQFANEWCHGAYYSFRLILNWHKQKIKI